MKIIAVLSFFVSMMTISSAVWAASEPILTLHTALDDALKNSPVIQRAEAVVNESRWKKVEVVGSGFLPRVSVNVGHYFTNEYELTSVALGGSQFSLPGAYPTTSAAINASLPIFDGLASFNRLRAATLAHDASEQEFDRAKFELTQNVRLAFYQSLAAVLLKDVAAQNVITLEDHLKQAEQQLRQGAATKYDTLRISVQLSEAKADSIDADDTEVVYRKKLTQLLGLEEDNRTLFGVLPTPDADLVKNLDLKSIPVERADIQALNMRSEAAEHTQSAQSVWLVPSISVAGQYMKYDLMSESAADGSVASTGTYKSAYNLGVFLTWNIFDGGVSLAQSREAAYQQIQADRRAQEAKLQVPLDYAYWKRRFLSNADHYRARQLDVERSEESVRLAKAEERAGTRTSTETLDAELDLFRSKAGVVNAQLNALEAQVRLELTLGRRI